MEKIFEIESWEPNFENYDDSDKYIYDDKMIYRAKVIGNNNILFKWKCNICGPIEVHNWIYKLSGLIIKIMRQSIHCSDGYVSEQPFVLEIRSEENPDEILYESGFDPIDGEWKKTFEELFKSSLKLTQEDNQKVYTKKQER